MAATRNKGKLRELQQLFTNAPVTIRGLEEFPGIEDIPETGATYEENACLKASHYASVTGLPALADDSGLEVNALDGRPGVYSARYAGTGLSYETRILRLLEEMRSAGSADRTARFVCVMALSRPDAAIETTALGICTGVIGSGPRGDSGFGYDPIFIPDGFDATFAELGEDVKGRISHRTRAAEIIIARLPVFIGN